MAANDDAPDWDDLTEVDSPGTTEENERTVRLDPGDRLLGKLRFTEYNAGQHNNTLVHLTTPDGEHVQHWFNRTLEEQLEDADASPGDWIGVEKSETQTTSDINGEEVEYYPRNLKVVDR
jgi:hypothetical protein